MSQGEGGGRPRKHARAIGQYALDAEWQEISDQKDDALLNPPQPASLPALIDETDNWNSKIAAIVVATREIAKTADRNNLDSLYDCLNQYLNFCIEHGVRITNMGAYTACGMSRALISNWASGQGRGADPAYQEFALLVRSICSETREMLMAEGKIHPVVGIWWQKNYDGFRDNPTEYVGDGREDEEASVNDVIEKYADSIGD